MKRSTRGSSAQLTSATWWVDPEEDQPIEVGAIEAATRPGATAGDLASAAVGPLAGSVLLPLRRVRSLKRYKVQRRSEAEGPLLEPRKAVPNRSGEAALIETAEPSALTSPTRHAERASMTRELPDRVVLTPQVVRRSKPSSLALRTGSFAVLLVAGSLLSAMTSTLRNDAPAEREAALASRDQPPPPSAGRWVDPDMSSDRPRHDAGDIDPAPLRLTGDDDARMLRHREVEFTSSVPPPPDPSSPALSNDGADAGTGSERFDEVHVDLPDPTEVEPPDFDLAETPTVAAQAPPPPAVRQRANTPPSDAASPPDVIAAPEEEQEERSRPPSQASNGSRPQSKSAKASTKRTTEQASAEPAREVASPVAARERSASTRGAVRITLHYSTLSSPNRGWAERLARHLNRIGHEVVAIRGHASEIGRSRIDFFHPDDRQTSQNLTAVVETTMGRFGGPTSVRSASPPSSSRQAGVMEIWLAGGLGS
jgi:hypothetical protein